MNSFVKDLKKDLGGGRGILVKLQVQASTLYLTSPHLYCFCMNYSLFPLMFQMRQADRNVVTALTHRPWHLSHFGDGTPRFNSSWKHYLYMMMDVILDWSLHNFLWRLCGVSAFLIQKNFVSQ